MISGEMGGQWWLDDANMCVRYRLTVEVDCPLVPAIWSGLLDHSFISTT